MPLSIPQPPDQVTATAQDGLARVMRRRDSLAFRGALAESGMNLRVPHKVYTLGLIDLIEGANLENAKFAGWRYLASPSVQLEGVPVGVAEVLDTGEGHRFASYNRGWLGTSTEKAVAKAQSLPQADTGDFELRMFRVPAAKIDTLWLKSETRNPDLIVPIASANPLIDVDVVYDAPAFLTLAREVAAQELKEDEAAGAAGAAQ